MATALGAATGSRQPLTPANYAWSCLELPDSCLLTFAARARGFIYDKTCIKRHPIKAADQLRRMHYPMWRGATLSGRVVDADTGDPIAAARISPMIWIDAPDPDQAVFSQKDGEFELTSANPRTSVLFEHFDYLDLEYDLFDRESQNARPWTNVTIKLKKGEAIFGSVRGPDNQPIQGAMVVAGDGKQIATAADGSFRIGSVKRAWGGAFFIQVSHPDYMQQHKMPLVIPKNGLEIQLDRLFEIRGRVITAHGEPVPRFTVTAGPGENPARGACAIVDVTSPDGRFKLAIDTQSGWPDRILRNQHWLAVRADGYAIWEGRVPFARDGAEVAITLAPGFTLSAALTGLDIDFNGCRAVLVPERPQVHEIFVFENAAAQFGSLETTLTPDGKLRFEHVRPDDYLLYISGRGITQLTVALRMGQEDQELAPLPVQGTGRIVGQVLHREGEPWESADCELIHAAGRRKFRAGEDGRFVLAEVPAGSVRVGVRLMLGCTYEGEFVDVFVTPGETMKVVIQGQEWWATRPG